MAHARAPREGGLPRRAFVRGIALALGGAAASSLSTRCTAPDAPAHPSLFFDTGDLDALRTRASTSLRSQRDALVAYAAEHLDEEPSQALSGDYEEKGDAIQDPWLSHILAFSFLCVMAGEDAYLAAARRWALALARMPELAGDLDAAAMQCTGCGYAEGWALIALACAYDWLHDRLDDGERALLKDRIRLLCKVLHDATFAGEWWTGAYLHHDTWIPLGGLGLGALSISGEVPEAQAWVERARHELEVALDWLDADGAWPEGPCGWAFALANVLPFWDAYRRRFPDEGRALLGNAWLMETWRFRVASRMPDGQFLGFGDCRISGGYQKTGFEGAPALRWLAARYQNPYAQWQAAREWEDRPNPYTAAWEIVWTDPDLDETPPDGLPHGALFANQAMAYLRTGWDLAATVLAYRATGLLGRRATSLVDPAKIDAFNNSITHTHADGNAFGIWSRGGFAITLAHYGQRETEFQNSLLVDGQGQYSAYGPDHLGRPDGQVTAFFASPQGAFVEGDAARCYPPGLDRFTRRLFLVDPGIVLVHDIVAASRPVSLEWRLHVDLTASLSLMNSGFTSVLDGATTVVLIAGPSGLAFGQLADHWNRAVTMTKGDKTAAAELCAVILPSLPAGAPVDVRAVSEQSFTIQVLDTTVLAAFSATPGALQIPGRLSANGSAAIAWKRGDTTGLLAVDATSLVLDGETLFEAATPVTIAYVRAGGSRELALSTAVAVTVRVASAGGAVVDVDAPAGVSSQSV